MARATATEECADLESAKATARRGRPAIIRGNGRAAYVLMTERRFRRMMERLAEVEEEERDAEEATRVLRRVHAGKEKTHSTEEVKRRLGL
jgi:PHD/YefM family antitoxin component YafN of YafNO toxin-antitoxin module